MQKLKLEELNRISIDEFKNSSKLPLTVILDDVRSLNNIGSVFRTADAFLIEKIYLCRDPVDFRKAINGLSMIVEEVLCLDPFSSQLFVFTNKRRNKIKILVWDKTGFILWLKSLDKAQFKWPLKNKEVVHSINGSSGNRVLYLNTI